MPEAPQAERWRAILAVVFAGCSRQSGRRSESTELSSDHALIAVEGAGHELKRGQFDLDRLINAYHFERTFRFRRALDPADGGRRKILFADSTIEACANLSTGCR